MNRSPTPADLAAEARAKIERGISIFLPKICLDFIEVTIHEAILAHEPRRVSRPRR
jgi:hypothetical protein